jgi:hypothetical protein
LAIAHFDIRAVDEQAWGLIHSPGVDLGDSTGQSLKVLNVYVVTATCDDSGRSWERWQDTGNNVVLVRSECGAE